MDLLGKMEIMIDNTKDLMESISTLQQNFMESDLYSIMDSAVNLGIKAALPDLIEDEVINIKDTILQNGIKEGAKEIISNVKDFGKSILGIATGNFENISQIQAATKSGGVIDTISKVVDKILDKLNDSGKLSNSVKKTIKNQKNSILKSIKNDISESLDNQVRYIEKINEYSNSWQEYYERQDINGMKNASKNIQKYLKNVIPLESIINKARKIETLQNFIENTRKI